MFFKKKQKEVVEVAKVTSRALDEIDADIEQLLKRLEAKEDVYNELAHCYYEKNDVDNAIVVLEKCLEENKTLGNNYNDLMKFYNIKRKEAAVNKDDEQIQLYLNKIDNLMQLSKDVIRGKI